MKNGIVIKRLYPKNNREKVYYCDCCENASDVKITLSKQKKEEKLGTVKVKLVTKDINLCSAHFESIKEMIMYVEAKNG